MGIGLMDGEAVYEKAWKVFKARKGNLPLSLAIQLLRRRQPLERIDTKTLIKLAFLEDICLV